MKKVIFFGAGEIGQKMLKYAYRSHMEVDFIVDNDSSLWDKVIDNKQIFPPKILMTQKTKYVIIVTLGNMIYPEVKRQLEIMGFRENVDFYYFTRIFPQENALFGKTSGVLDISNNLHFIKTLAPNKVLIDFEKKVVYRIISPELSDQFKEIFSRCMKSGLFGKYIIETKLTHNINISRRSLVFEHVYIPVLSYAMEWSPQMFYQYTLFMIEFLVELDKNGLGWSDVHAFNATFYKGKFIFFDFDAIDNKKTPFFIIKEFIDSHIIILLMMTENLLSKAYMYLNNAAENPSIYDIEGYLSENKKIEYQDMYHECYVAALSGNIIKCGMLLKKYINKFKFASLSHTDWDGYQNDLYEKKDIIDWNNKQSVIIKMIYSVAPNTLLDLAGNMGWYELVVHDKLKYCIVADLDYNCIDFVFKKIQHDKIENIYPVYLNLITPTVAYYRDFSLGNTAIIPWRKSAIERLKCDLVLALAIVHHLVFRQQLSFREIIDLFYLYTNKWLIIEFIEHDDCIIAEALKNADFAWYTKENFEKELLKHFTIMKIYKSELTRVVYLCEKK